MQSSLINHTSNDLFETLPDSDRGLLQIYTGNHISDREARTLLRRIADHKWYVSEKLERDVGFRVAAIDYVENFYQPSSVQSSPLNNRFTKVMTLGRKAMLAYLTAKGNTPPL